MKTQYLVAILIIFISCKAHTQFDGSYCAEINRYNPKTQKQSNYTLIVKIEDNILQEIHFPSGGYSDSSDFEYPKFDGNYVSFRDNDNVQFEITVIQKGTDCFAGGSGLVQCSGKTRKGRRCKNMVGKGYSLCAKHR